MYTLTIATSKGGVGKSTTVANLAAALAEAGRRVLVVDVDPGFTITRMLGQRPAAGSSSFDLLVRGDVALEATTISVAPNLDLVPGSRDLTGLDLTLASGLHREYRLATKIDRAPYDVVLIDTPPAGTLATTNALIASDYALAILSCEDAYSLQGIQELRLQLELMGGGPTEGPSLVGVLRTFVDRRSDVYQSLMAFPEVAELPLLDTEILLRRALRKSGAAGVPEVMASPDSESACQYRKLRIELETTIQNKENNNGEDAAANVSVRAGAADRQPDSKLAPAG